MKQHFLILDRTSGARNMNNTDLTKEQALQIAKERATRKQGQFVVYQAIAVVRPPIIQAEVEEMETNPPAANTLTTTDDVTRGRAVNTPAEALA